MTVQLDPVERGRSRPASVASRFAYQPALDGVRAVAVAAVLAFHAGFGWMSGGYVGVSVFFTLSGYLLTSLALVEWDLAGRLNVTAFYGRRIRRLLPASLACLAAVVVAAFAGQFHGVANLRRDLWAAIGQVYNWVVLAGGEGYADQMAEAAGQRAPLDHYWSLAVEEQFYWLWPIALLAILRCSRSGRLVVVGGLLAAATAAALAIAVVAGDAAAYLATPARLPEILAGCLLAVVLHSGHACGAELQHRRGQFGRLGPVLAGSGLAVIVWAAIRWPADSGPAYDGWLPAFAIASVALIAGMQSPSPLRTLLSAPPLVALGRISYGVYLFHWPVYTVIDERRLDIGRPALFVVRVAITLGVAAASYHLVERPVRVRAAGWRRSAGVAAIACAAAAAVVVVVPDRPATFNYVTAATQARVAIAPATGQRLAPPGERPLSVLIVGDSTAMATSSGLVEWAARHPGVLQVSSAAVMGCGLNPAGELPDDGYREVCAELVRELPGEVGRLRPDVVVAMVTMRDMEDRVFNAGGPSLTPTDTEFAERLRDGYVLITRALLDAGAGTVVWLTPPTPALPRVGKLAPLLDPARVEAYRDVLRSLPQHVAGVHAADLAGWMAEQDDPPRRVDGLHWSPEGAIDLADRYLVPLIVGLRDSAEG